MKKFHQIVVAVDFTPSCRVAVKEALRRSSLDQASVCVVHVMDEFLIHELSRALSVSKQQVIKDWEAKLTQFVESSDVGGPFTVEVRYGSPVLALTEVCKERKADLLIMGAKGSRNEPNRIGAVVARCIRSAPVDVLVVRTESPGPFKKVVACVDFSENSAKAVQCALHFAKQDGGALDCLHVVQSALAMAADYGGFMPSLPVAEVDTDTRKRWEEELEQFLEPLTRTKGETVITRVVTEQLNIREAILAHVASAESDLVVLGTRGKSNLRTLLIGTTAERIVQHVPCSILAVKPDEIVEGGAS